MSLANCSVSTCGLPDSSIACTCATLLLSISLSCWSVQRLLGRLQSRLSNVVGAQRRGGGRRGFARLAGACRCGCWAIAWHSRGDFHRNLVSVFGWVTPVKRLTGGKTLIASANYSALTVVTTPLSATIALMTRWLLALRTFTISPLRPFFSATPGIEAVIPALW